MIRIRILLTVGWLSACTTYTPAPVDLSAHAAAFAARLPATTDIVEAVARLSERLPAPPAYDPTDGLTRTEARLLTLLLHPELRAARLHAGVTAAAHAHAGTVPDPEFSADFAKILENVDHPWLAGGTFGITLPLTGRRGAEKTLAGAEHDAALLQARIAEAAALDALDAAWVHWSAARLRSTLLDELLTQVRALEALALQLAEHGELTRLAARAFTLERLARQTEQLTATAATAQARLRVLALLGLPPEATVELLPETAIEDRAGDAEARSERLLTGPRVQRAQQAHAIAEHQLELAVAQQWPSLTLLPGFAEEDAQPRALLGFSLPLPLWNRNGRAIAEATATRDLRAEELRIAIEDASTRLADADLQLTAATTRKALITDELLPAAAAQVADGHQLAELGQLEPLLLLDTLSRAHDAQLAAIDASVAEAQARIARNTLFWPDLWLPTAEEDR